MTKNEELFYLVQSLSRSEKRYFTLFCRQQGGGATNYLKLFEELVTQTQYDEAAIRKKFKGETFLKQLHVTKSYLRQLIFKSLRGFHQKLSKDAEVKDALRNIEILFHKELYQHCKGELRRAEQIAKQYELFTSLIEIHGWKRKLRQTLQPHDYPGFKTILNEQAQALHQSKNQNDYLQLIVDLSSRITSQSTHDIPHQAWLSNPQNALSLEAMVMHYNANYFLSINQNASKKGEEALCELVDFLEQHPHRIIENPGLYVATVNNLTTYYVFNKLHSQALGLIQRARKFYAHFKLKSENRTLLKQVLRTYNIELEIYRDSRLHTSHPEVVEDIETFVEKHTLKMPKDYLISFWFQLADIRFFQGHFSKALTWVNHILQHNFKDLRIDIQVHARFLNLVIHLEQQNYFVLRYFVEATRRFIRKRRQLELYEKQLLAFFIKISKSPSLEYKDRYRDFYEFFFGSPPQGNIPDQILDYVDYKSWLEKKNLT